MLVNLSVFAVALLAFQIGLSSSTNVRQRSHEDYQQAPSTRYNHNPHENMRHYQSGPPMESLIDPMKAAASHHHHKGGAKGWLDMGAWTKKKGAFGWYADYPVGKG